MQRLPAGGRPTVLLTLLREVRDNLDLGEGGAGDFGPVSDARAMDFPNRLTQFDQHLEVAGIAETTRRSYRYQLLRFYADTAQDPTCPELCEDDVVAYVATLPANGSARGDVLRALKAYSKWALGRRRLDDPTERLRIPRSRATPAPLIPDEAVRDLLRAAFRREPRRGWTFLLACSTGVRVGSLVRIRASDIAGGSLHVRVAKGGNTYTVPLARTARVAADHLATIHPKGPLVGVGEERVRQWMREASSDAGLKDVLWHPHQLRHYFGTKLARIADPDSWRRLMGHADLSQYPRYVARDDDRLRMAVEEMSRSGDSRRTRAVVRTPREATGPSRRGRAAVRPSGGFTVP